MKRLLAAFLCFASLGIADLSFAGPYIVCFEIQPSGRMNYWGEPVYCAKIVGYKEWERDSYYSPVYEGQRICPPGTQQRVYDSYHHIGKDLDLCP